MKERKILTKLGIIFGIIDLLLILFGVIFLKPKQVLAESTTDFILNNEIYLFSDINAINFESGYIDKELITTESQNNNANHFAWYWNLGYKLVERHFEAGYHCLAIPLNGMLSNYLQFAFAFSTGPDLAMIIKYSDGSTTEFATSDYSETKQLYTPSPNELNKSVNYIAWEIYAPDYYISFLPLTSENYYNLGYENGYSNGFDYGNETGYNAGHYDGYQEGITQSDEVIYEKLLDFNQLIKNGNFIDTNYWYFNSYISTFSVSDNTMYVTGGSVGLSLAQNFSQNIPFNHQLLIMFECKSNNINQLTLQFRFDSTSYNSINYDIENNFKKYYSIINTYNELNKFQFFRATQNATAEFKNIQMIDLTQMYGANFEPNLEQCKQIFSNDYYDFTLSNPVDIGYYTGYYEGKNEGIQQGINIGETNQINMSWIQSIFQAMQNFFNIQIFPRVTLGIIVGIPFIISLAWFVIRMFRGGGGGED